jgi:hypothetical protein
MLRLPTAAFLGAGLSSSSALVCASAVAVAAALRVEVQKVRGVLTNTRHSHFKWLQSSRVNEHGYVQWRLSFLSICSFFDVQMSLHTCYL